jgi:hypothetical protein
LRLSNALLREAEGRLERTEHPRFSLIARWRARKAQQRGNDRS